MGYWDDLTTLSAHPVLHHPACVTETGDTFMSNVAPGHASSHSARRTVFRALGVLLLLAGLTFVALAVADFLAGADELGAQPTRFWMFFVGIPLTFAGGVLTQLGFAGAATRYMAREYGPVLADSLDELGFGPRTSSSSPTSGPYCRSCGQRNDDEARFCDRCGSALGA